MSYGDYRMCGSDIFIERKSLADFFSTLGYQSERFEKEIIRAQNDNAYLVVLVEEPFEEIYTFTNRHGLSSKIKISPEVPLFHMRELSQKYSNLQFLFVKNRVEASRIIELIFSAGEQVKQVDLQYLSDTNQL